MSVDTSDFFIVTPIINSPNYRVRGENYRKFRQMCEASGVTLFTIEAAFGDRPFEVTERDNPYHLQFRTIEELWHKENLINLGINYALQVNPSLRKVAWIDSDCFPMCPPREWMEKTVLALDHFKIVQMWSYLINFGPDFQPISQPQMSFMKTYAAAGYQVPKAKSVRHTLSGHSGLVSLGRPGLAWAADLQSLSEVGMLPERCILGSGDWHFAHALVEAQEMKSAEHQLSEYSKYLLEFQTRASRWIKKDVGHVEVTVGHWYHGDKVDRRYGDRGQILIEAGYNPWRDVKHDAQGLLQLETFTSEQIRLRDQIRAYMAGRNEDSVPLR